MLSDGLTQKQSEAGAHEKVEVGDVAQMLLAAVRRADGPTPPSGVNLKRLFELFRLETYAPNR